MANKVYGIYGRTAAIIQIQKNDGKAFLEVEFKNGNINDGSGYRPATYSTSSPVEQILIETSSYYRSGMVKIVREYRDENDEIEEAQAASAEGKDSSITAEILSFPEVESREDAIEVLKANGCKAQTLASDNAIKRWMAAHRIEFPNYNF